LARLRAYRGRRRPTMANDELDQLATPLPLEKWLRILWLIDADGHRVPTTFVLPQRGGDEYVSWEGLSPSD